MPSNSDTVLDHPDKTPDDEPRMPDDRGRTPGDRPRVPDHRHEFRIIVNGRERIVTSDELSFDDVLALAFNPVPSGPNWEFTVSYRGGAERPFEGRLHPGDKVKIKSGTVFNATATDKS